MGQITPFGAVFGPGNMPSPMESFDYFKNLKDRDKAMAANQQMAAAKAKQEADDNFDKMLKPVREFKSATGFSTITPDAIVTADAKKIEAAAAEMHKQGKPATEVAMFLSDQMRNLGLKHTWYKNAKDQLEKELGTIDKSGLDVNRVRELAEAYLLESKPGEQVAGILPKVLEKYGSAIPVNNMASAFDIKRDETYSNEFKRVKAQDGSVSAGVATAKYNPLFQEVVMDKDNTVKVLTKGVPAVYNGAEVTGIDGKPVMVLPQEAYIELESNPARKVEITKLAEKIKNRQQAQINEAAEKKVQESINQKYGIDGWNKLPAGQRLQLRKILKASAMDELSQSQGINDEVIRQQAAYEVADKYIPKANVGINKVKDPTVINIGRGGGGSSSGGKSDSNADFMDAYGILDDNIPEGGVAPLGEYPETSAHVISLLKANGFKKEGKDPLTNLPVQEDINLDDVVVIKMDGKLYAQFAGQKMQLPKYALNKKANPGDAKTNRKILEDAKSGSPTNNKEDLRKKYDY